MLVREKATGCALAIQCAAGLCVAMARVCPTPLAPVPLAPNLAAETAPT